MILEYCANGNLFNYLRSENGHKFSAKELMDIFVSVCESVAFMHEHKMIHRDIKPENILLDDNLEPKLCDFGWSIELKKNEKRQTFCGTYEYMAPEIFESENYYSAVDVWSLGILLYELFHGTSPFVGNSIFSIYKNIIKESIRFSDDFDDLGKQLVTQILKLNPAERPTVQEILHHPFIQNHKNSAWTFVPRLGNDHLIIEDNQANADIMVNDCSDSPLQRTRNKQPKNNNPPTISVVSTLQSIQKKPKPKTSLPKPSPTNHQVAPPLDNSKSKSKPFKANCVYKLKPMNLIQFPFEKVKGEIQRNFKKQTKELVASEEQLTKHSNVFNSNYCAQKQGVLSQPIKSLRAGAKKQPENEQLASLQFKSNQSNVEEEMAKLELANLYTSNDDFQKGFYRSKGQNVRKQSASVDSQKEKVRKQSADKKVESEESTEFSRTGLNLQQFGESFTDDCLTQLGDSDKCLLVADPNNIYTAFKGQVIETCFGKEQLSKTEQQAFKLNKSSLFSSKNRQFGVSKLKQLIVEAPKPTAPAALVNKIGQRLNKSIPKEPLLFGNTGKKTKNSLFNKQTPLTKGSLWKYMHLNSLPSKKIRTNSLDICRKNNFRTFTDTKPSSIEGVKFDCPFTQATMYATAHSFKQNKIAKADFSGSATNDWSLLAETKVSLDSPTELPSKHVLQKSKLAGQTQSRLRKDNESNAQTATVSADSVLESRSSLLFKETDLPIQAPRNSENLI